MSSSTKRASLKLLAPTFPPRYATYTFAKSLPTEPTLLDS
jgi:hypothetical protein